MEEVYFIKKDFELGIKKAYSLLSGKKFKNKKQKIAIKLHFGEKGCDTFVSPKLVEYLTKNIKQKFVLTDCNVLYKGSRTNTNLHLKTAKHHGFKNPIEIGDDKGETKITINKKHFKKIKVGKILKDYKNIIVFSHFKGHPATGFGGALKNLGMGFGSRAGKLSMHSKICTSINQEKCTLCDECKKNCPAKAIETKNNKNIINKEKCIGCAKCIAVCPVKAIKIPWGSIGKKGLQERITEYCYGISKNRNIIYFNILTKITKGCDCMGKKQKPFMKDIGILASSDPIAIEQASLDLIKKHHKGKNPFEKINNVSGLTQLKYGEKLGLGKRKYKLIGINKK